MYIATKKTVSVRTLPHHLNSPSRLRAYPYITTLQRKAISYPEPTVTEETVDSGYEIERKAKS